MLIDMHVDGIITDYPDRLRDLLRSRSSQELHSTGLNRLRAESPWVCPTEGSLRS
jgi:hypothetical protein